MNFAFGTRLPDGRRVGIEWRRRRAAEGTVIQAFVRHQGDLSAEDLERCLEQIGEGERFVFSASATPRHPASHRRGAAGRA